MNPALDEVVQETDDNRRRFEAFSRSLTNGQLEAVIPGETWRVKDYIAHLASIDIYVGEWFEHQADGCEWRPKGDDGGAFDIDVWNEARIQERYDHDVDELLHEAAAHRERLWAAVDRFTPEVLEARFDFRDRNISFLRYMRLWAGHDPAHVNDAIRAIPEVHDDAELEAWLARYRA